MRWLGKKTKTIIQKCKLHIKNSLSKMTDTRGSILIEFAVCMPVLIGLLFLINDFIREKSYRDKTDFVSLQMVNILQNIGYTDHEIGINNLSQDRAKDAVALAYLSIYPGTTMYKKDASGHGLIHTPQVNIYCVSKDEDESDDISSSCVWGWRIRSIDSSTNPETLDCSDISADSNFSIINWKTNTNPTSIYPNLSVSKSTPKKMIVEASLHWEPNQSSASGRKVDASGKVFGCFGHNPSSATSKKGYNYSFFPAICTFTPNEPYSFWLRIGDIPSPGT